MNTAPKKTRVLFLITKSNWGGAQRYVFDVATNFASDTYDVAVAVGGAGPLVQKLNAANIETITIPSLQRDISIIKEIRSLFEIARIIRQQKPDVLHINSSKAGGIGTFLGRLFSVPRVIFTAHAWAFNEQRPLWQKVLVKYLHWVTVFFSHQTIVVSHALKEQMNWPGARKKMTVIHNGLPAIDFVTKDEARKKIRSFTVNTPDQESIWTGSIGELHPVKGHEVMIQAIAQLISEGHNIHHFILGKGELKDRLRTLVTTLNLCDHISLTGHIDEAASLLPAFDIYVQPSYSEALGYTVAEAAQAGLPIIASDVGGIPEIIENDVSGQLVPPGDTDALENALKIYIKDTSLRAAHSAEAQEKSQAFTINTMMTATEKVYAGNNSLT